MSSAPKRACLSRWFPYFCTALIPIAAVFSGCGEDPGKGTAPRKAAEEIITKDFKLYEGAKDKLNKATQAQEQRRRQEQQLP